MARATAELSGALAKLATGVLSAAVGGAVVFAGFLMLLLSAVLGLALVLAPWLAALIVGAVVGGVGVLMVLAGRKAIDPSVLKPQRTAESLRRDKEVLSRSTS
jgi:hypothetical protein